MMQLSTLRALRGLTQAELARKLDFDRQTVYAYESGRSHIGTAIAPKFAEALQVSAAYLIGKPDTLPVYDYNEHTTAACSIIAANELHEDGKLYGVFYLVEHPVTGLLAVIIADGIQFTTNDWQDEQPTEPEKIKDFYWVDATTGHYAIMYNGLPRILVG